MQKHPMYSVKEAAAALGCDERWVREQLNQGQLKGEKKSIGLKDKWFVYKGEIDTALARKGVTRQVSAATEHGRESDDQNSHFFGVDNADSTEDAIEVDVRSNSSQSSDASSMAELVRVIANQFAEKLDEQKNVNLQLQRELEDKERQLKLLPDLQKRAEEANLKEFEVNALKKQLEEVQELKQKAEIEARKAQELEQNVVPELKQKVASAEALKFEEIATLTEQVRTLDAKRQEFEDEKVKALEELTRVQNEKDTQVAAMQEQLTALTEKLEKSSASWWKKFFLGSGS